MNSITTYLNDFCGSFLSNTLSLYERIKGLVILTYVTHPNGTYHILFTIIIALSVLLLWTQFTLIHRINASDKRTTIALLSIQKHSITTNHAINALTDVIEANHRHLYGLTKRSHTRMKDIYTGIFKHLNLNRIRRAPRTDTPEHQEAAKKASEERNAILHEVYEEMKATD